MNKQTFLLLISALLVLQTNAQTELLTPTENKLYGPVKSVINKVSWLKQMFGEWETASPYYNESATFNKDGLLTSSSREEGRFGSAYTFQYKNNRLSQKKDLYGVAKEKKEHSWKYQYDAQGRETVEDMFDGDGEFLWKQKKHYYDDGRLKESIYYSQDGSVATRKVYQYTAGNLSKDIEYNSKNEVYKMTIYEYDKAGNKIAQELNEKSGELYTTTTWRYTYEGGRKTGESKLVFSKGKEKRNRYELDEWGNITKHYSETGTVYTTTYTFDNQHNWITATTTFDGFDGPAAYRQQREISYY